MHSAVNTRPHAYKRRTTCTCEVHVVYMCRATSLLTCVMFCLFPTVLPPLTIQHHTLRFGSIAYYNVLHIEYSSTTQSTTVVAVI